MKRDRLRARLNDCDIRVVLKICPYTGELVPDMDTVLVELIARTDTG